MADLTSQESDTADAYDAMAERWTAAQTKVLFWKDEIRHLHELLPHGRILEIGAGGGRDAKELIAQGYEYVGTDISENMLAVARRVNPGGVFERISLYDLAYPELFDGFWCTAVLLHIPRDRINEALGAIRRNMREGAVGFLTVKQGDGEEVRYEDESKKSNARLFTYWQNDDFKEVLKTSGFEIIEEKLKSYNENYHYLSYFVRVRADES